MTPNSTLRRSFPTFRYVVASFLWIVATRRRMLIVSAVLLAMIAVPLLWWSMQLTGLPDVGEPFDMAELRSIAVPDDRNPFVLYLQAAARFKPLKALLEPSDKPIDPYARWPEADPRFRRGAEENREALAVYRQAAERPEPAPESDDDYYRMWLALHHFHLLALLEGSRLEDQGDMAAAWGWYRAVLRTAHHEGAYGGVARRSNAQGWCYWLSFRLNTWAADPRTTAAMLRQALDDALACGAIRPSESYTLKLEYLLLKRMLDHQRSPVREVTVKRWNAIFGFPDHYLSPDQMQTVYDGWRFWRREPERSRRVIRLAVANWLAYDELPPDRRPEPDLKVQGKHDFYAFGPEAPARARALSPEALDRWLATTIDAQELLPRLDTRSLRIQERTSHRKLVLLLASQLYRRERGTDPPSDEALVGTYLKELPDDGSGNAGHQAASAAGVSPSPPGSAR